jgi:hypothetical protein
MASYTSTQLYGPGTPTEALRGTLTFTFTNLNDSPTYFTIETVRNANGVYDSTSATNALGVYSNFTDINIDSLITSSYIASVILPPGASRFQFNSTVNVAVSGSFLRATGETSLIIS